MSNSQLPFATLTKQTKAAWDKGDLAKDKAEQFYISAGRLAAEMKARFKQEYKGKMSWAAYTEKYLDRSASRTNDLIAIADGRATIASTRENTNSRVMKHRQENKPPLRNGGNNSQELTEFESDDDEDGMAEPSTKFERQKLSFILRASESRKMAALFADEVDSEMLSAARATVEKWQVVAQQIEDKLK